MQLITNELTSSFVSMRRELVDDLLKLNTKNRNMRPFVVDTYRRALECNLWLPTSQGIGVSASGFLVDGQHRLEALKSAGYPDVVMLVVTGLPDEAVAAVDNGANRSARDYMQFMFDIKISGTVSAVLRASMLAQNKFEVVVKYLPQEYAAHLEQVGSSISKIMRIEGALKLPAAVIAALVDMHNSGYEVETEAFTKAVSTGEMLERDNPALVLRNWIANTKGTGGGTIMMDRYYKTTRALQSWIDRTPITKLYRTKATLAKRFRKQ